MRKAVIAFLMAATAGVPVAASAQDAMPERYQRQAERNQQRYERQQQRSEQRQQAAPRGAEQRAVRQAARAERQQQRAERRADQAEGAPVVVQRDRGDRRAERAERRAERQAAPVVVQRDRGDRRQDRREAFRDRIRETREASRRGAEGLPPSYQRQAARNQARYEEQLRERRQDRREDRLERRADRRDYRQDRREWRRDWRQDRRYDWQRYRYSNRDLYRGGRYYAPYRNHGYSRFSIGLFLNSGFYSNRYWINDPWQYRLPPAYAGTRWVRYYDDVLLVDLYTGEVLDVIYDFFW